MLPERNARNWVRRLMRSEVRLTEAFAVSYESGHVIESYVTLPKLLLVQQGVLEYELNACRMSVPAGSVLYRPPRTRSRWTVTSEDGVQMAWAEFSLPDGIEAPPMPLVREVDAALESFTLARLFSLWIRPSDDSAAIIAEAELKSALARFFLGGRVELPMGISAGGVSPAQALGSSRTRPKPAEAVVRAAVDFLGQHHAEPDALDRMWSSVRLSPTHFRVVFRRIMGKSPREQLLAIRMSAARAKLLRGEQTVKEVAFAVGMPDAFYFFPAIS